LWWRDIIGKSRYWNTVSRILLQFEVYVHDYIYPADDHIDGDTINGDDVMISSSTPPLNILLIIILCSLS